MGNSAFHSYDVYICHAKGSADRQRIAIPLSQELQTRGLKAFVSAHHSTETGGSNIGGGAAGTPQTTTLGTPIPLAPLAVFVISPDLFRPPPGQSSSSSSRKVSMEGTPLRELEVFLQRYHETTQLEQETNSQNSQTNSLHRSRSGGQQPHGSSEVPHKSAAPILVPIFHRLTRQECALDCEAFYQRIAAHHNIPGISSSGSSGSLHSFSKSPKRGKGAQAAAAAAATTVTITPWQKRAHKILQALLPFSGVPRRLHSANDDGQLINDVAHKIQTELQRRNQQQHLDAPPPGLFPPFFSNDNNTSNQAPAAEAPPAPLPPPSLQVRQAVETLREAKRVPKIVVTLKTLQHWASSSRRKSVEIVRAGGIPAVIRVLAAHTRRPQVQLAGCATLWNLAWHNQANQVLILWQGGVPTLLEAIGNFPRNVPVYTTCCLALSVLALHPQNGPQVARQVVTLNGLQMILQAMRRYKNNTDVQWTSCGTLGNLAAAGQTDDVPRAITQMGGLPLILLALQKHATMSPEVALWSCQALSLLAIDAENQDTLGNPRALNAIPLILNAARIHPGHAGVQLRACAALGALCLHHESNQQVVAQNAGLESLLQALHWHAPQNPHVTQWVLQALAVVASLYRPNVGTLRALGALPTILDAMMEYTRTNAAVQLCGLQALRSLVVPSIANRDLLVELGGLRVISNAMETHIHVLGLQVEAFRNLWCLNLDKVRTTVTNSAIAPASRTTTATFTEATTNANNARNSGPLSVSTSPKRVPMATTTAPSPPTVRRILDEHGNHAELQRLGKELLTTLKKEASFRRGGIPYGYHRPNNSMSEDEASTVEDPNNGKGPLSWIASLLPNPPPPGATPSAPLPPRITSPRSQAESPSSVSTNGSKPKKSLLQDGDDADDELDDDDDVGTTLTTSVAGSQVEARTVTSSSTLSLFRRGGHHVPKYNSMPHRTRPLLKSQAHLQEAARSKFNDRPRVGLFAPPPSTTLAP